MTPPRLLIVANELESFFNHRLPIARAAQAAGYDVHVALEEATAARERDTDGFAFHALPLARGFAAPWREAAALWRIDRLVARLGPGIVHAFTLKPVLHAGLVTRARGIAFVASVTGVGSFFLGTSRRDRVIQGALMPALGFALGGARRIAIVQNPDDEALVTQALRVPPTSVELIRGSGVDLDVFAPAPSPPPAPPVRIVLAARMLADKGVREFVEAARLLRHTAPDAQFILAGGLDPANRSAIARTELDAWAREPNIEWTGHVSDMAALYRSAHIACLPSYREGLPKALLEAAACGLPVVTTDAPGCREIVVDGRTGRLVPVRNAAALARALAALIADPALRTEMGAAGRDFVADGLSVEAVVGRIVSVYRRLERAGR